MTDTIKTDNAAVIAALEDRIADLRVDLAEAIGNPNVKACGICDRPLMRCGCDEVMREKDTRIAELEKAATEAKDINAAVMEMLFDLDMHDEAQQLNEARQLLIVALAGGRTG